jgi:hypothetical protein
MPLPQTTPKLVKRVRGPVGHAVGPHVGPIPSSPPIAEPYGTEGEPRGDTEGEGRRGNKMKWIRINLSCDGCSPEELDALEECASPRRLLTLSSPGGEEEAFPAGIPTDWWTAAADRMNLGLSRSEPDLLRYVSSSMTWVEDRLQRGDQVFLMLCPLSTAWLAAWMIRQSYRKDAARARMTNPEVQGALEWASDVTQWHNDPEDGPMCNLNASMVHQLEMLRAGVSAAHSAASSVVALPRSSSLITYTPIGSNLPTFPCSVCEPKHITRRPVQVKLCRPV